MTKPVLKGVIKTWKEDRGFGFIAPDRGGRDLFIHISALGQAAHKPKPGDIVHYQVNRDRQGKLRAVNARIETGKTSWPAQARSPENKPIWKWLTLTSAIVLGLGGIIFYYLKTRNVT